MKLIITGVKFGVVGFVGILTYGIIQRVWDDFWGAIAKRTESMTKKKETSEWERSVKVEVDDGR